MTTPLTTHQHQARLGGNLVAASLLALFSYVPFEYVAKISLIVAAGLFILDPIPPLTRLIAVVLLLLVSFLSKVERAWREGQANEQDTEGGTETAAAPKETKKEK
jgi:flagellar biosynthesis component FlhA